MDSITALTSNTGTDTTDKSDNVTLCSIGLRSPRLYRFDSVLVNLFLWYSLCFAKSVSSQKGSRYLSRIIHTVEYLHCLVDCTYSYDRYSILFLVQFFIQRNNHMLLLLRLDFTTVYPNCFGILFPLHSQSNYYVLQFIVSREAIQPPPFLLTPPLHSPPCPPWPLTL